MLILYRDIKQTLKIGHLYVSLDEYNDVKGFGVLKIKSHDNTIYRVISLDCFYKLTPKIRVNYCRENTSKYSEHGAFKVVMDLHKSVKVWRTETFSENKQR